MKTHSCPWVDKSKRVDCLILFLPFVPGLQTGTVGLNLSAYAALARCRKRQRGWSKSPRAVSESEEMSAVSEYSCL